MAIRSRTLTPPDHPVEIIMVRGNAGSTYRFVITQTYERALRAQMILVVLGRIRITRLTGETTGTGVYDIAMGQSGFDILDLPPLVTPGTFELSFVEDAIWYCLRRANNGPIPARTVNMVLGREAVALQDDIIFLGRGSVTTAGGRTFTAPALVQVDVVSATVTAQNRVIGALVRK